MRLKFNSDLFSLLDLIRSECRPGQELYLVGGAVRDVLLGQKLHDLDFVMLDNPTSLAKSIAKRLKADFFVLDDDRHTARVVYHNLEGNYFPLDFVQFTGESLLEDLENRDFTINAMAVSIFDLTAVIDPLDGQTDLTEGRIRACSNRALLDDPVRVLRGIRLALQFNFKFAQGLDVLMREAAAHLPETSYERQRDELFKILEGPHPSVGVAQCRQFQVFETLIPPLVAQEAVPASPPHVLPLFDHTISVVDHYHLLLQRLHPDSEDGENTPWWLDQFVSSLGQFSNELNEYFNEELTPGRTKRGLALLGAVLHDIGKPLTVKTGEDGRLHYYDHDNVGADLAWEAAQHLQLSKAESAWLRTLVRDHMRLLSLANAEEPPSRRSVYRFFNAVGEVGVAITLLSLADTLATYGQDLPQDKWHTKVSISQVLMTAWWEKRDAVISPLLLLNGHDLQKYFGLKPGKQIGRLMADLAEAQASGEILTEEEARAFIRAKLAKN